MCRGVYRITWSVIAARFPLRDDAGMTSWLVAGILTVGGVGAAAHGVRLATRAMRRADDPTSSLWLIRGIRGLVTATAAWALAAGLLFAQTWLLVFGGVFLAEELYETGVVIAVLRWSHRVPGATPLTTSRR